MATRKKTTSSPAAPSSAAFEHKGAEALIRPEVGVQSRFKKRKPQRVEDVIGGGR